MRKLTLPLVLLLLVAAAPCLSATAPSASGNILIERQAVDLPAYDEASELPLYATPDEYRQAKNDAAYCFEKLWYESDGLRVAAYLYAPCTRTGARLPAIVFNHGGFAGGDPAATLLPAFHRFAQAGFAVLAPLYRGNAGGEGRDEMGGADLDEVLAVSRLASELGFIDTHNLFLCGESRGGMMTYQAIRDGFPANAAAVYGAFTTLGGLIAEKPEQYKPILHVVWPDFDEHRDAILSRRSALEWPEALGIPILMMHGGADESVSPSETLRLATELQKLGTEYGLRIYGGDNHVLTRHRFERDQAIVDWFNAHRTSDD